MHLGKERTREVMVVNEFGKGSVIQHLHERPENFSVIRRSVNRILDLPLSRTLSPSIDRRTTELFPPKANNHTGGVYEVTRRF